MIVLGLCWNHDSHAAIIKQGKILVSIGEERLSRVKNHYGFPIELYKNAWKKQIFQQTILTLFLLQI